MAKRLSEPSNIGSLATKAFADAANNAVARAKIAGVALVGLKPKAAPKKPRSRKTAKLPALSRAD